MDLERALDEIYGAPLDTFTATRNRVAKDLKASGDEDASQRVAKLKKPNIAAWATNQLARTEGRLIEELLGASDDLRRAQRRVLSGGKPETLRKASDVRKRVTGQLVDAARQILEGAGHAATPSTLQAIAGTLTAVAADHEAAEAVRRGRLEREIAPQPITDLPGLWVVGDEDDDAAAADVEDDPGDLEELRRTAGETKQDAARLRRAADKAAADVVRADAKADRLAEEAERLRARAEDADRAAAAAREEAGFAKRTADAKRQEADEADAAAAQAAAALERAEGSR